MRKKLHAMCTNVDYVAVTEGGGQRLFLHVQKTIRTSMDKNYISMGLQEIVVIPEM